MFFSELATAIDAAKKAGIALLDMRLNGEPLQIKKKSQNQLVTAADFKSQDIICTALKKSFESYGILSEESLDDTASWREKEYTWIIDPLDGTEHFIFGGNDFGVHIGLSQRGQPLLGVNYYPAKDLIYWAVKGDGAYKQLHQQTAKKLSLSSDWNPPIICLRSKSETIFENFEKKKLVVGTSEYIGSTGLRLCLIAEGYCHLYMTSGLRAGLWDFLSGEIILKEAGGMMSDWNGQPIDYLNCDAKLTRGIIASGNQKIHEKFLALLQIYK